MRYNYIGTNDDFNRFLRNVVMDYLQVDGVVAEDEPTKDKEEHNDQQVA